MRRLSGFVKVVKKLPKEVASREPFRVDCSKRKGHFDYVESVLPSLLEHHFISITPAMSQRRDRYSLLNILSCVMSILKTYVSRLMNLVLLETI